MHSHQCPPGRRHCQRRFLQGIPEEGLAPLLMIGVLKPGYPKCFGPCFSLDDLLLGERFDDSKSVQLSLEDKVMVSCSFRTALTTSLAGLLGKVACSASLLFLKAFEPVC